MYIRLFLLALKECVRQPVKILISVIIVAVCAAALVTAIDLDVSLNRYITHPESISSAAKSAPAENGTAKNTAWGVSSGTAHIFLYRKMSKLLDPLIFVITGFLIFVIYLSTVNIMLSDNKKPALYKAEGFCNGHITFAVLCEILLVTLTGFLIALPLAAAVNTNLIPYLFGRYLGAHVKMYGDCAAYLKMLLAILFSDAVVAAYFAFKIRKIYPVSLMKES